MTETSLGAARIDVEVDVSQLEAAVRLAKNRLADMSTDAQKQYAQMDAAGKRFIDRLHQQVDKQGLSTAQQLAYNAALKTSGPVLDDLTRKIAQNEAKLRAGAVQFNQFGVSAKQTAFALRQVPAQLTDIVVGLSAGQAPLTVLLQQGGQLKDLFGGIGPAAGALGRSLLGLVNPYTLVAGSVGALAFAYSQAREESFNFEKAIIMSGNAAGLNAGQLEDMATHIDKVAGTHRNAARVLAQLEGTGRVGAEAMELAATAAIKLQRVGGVAIDETIRKFVLLGEKPTEASRKLNEQYGYLTASAFDRIKTLEKEGHVTEAAALAQRAYALEGISQADQLAASLNGITKGAKATKSGFAEMWDAFLAPFRDQDTPEKIADRLAMARKALTESSRFDEYNGANNRRRKVISGYESQLAALGQSEKLTAQKARERTAVEAFNDASDRWDKLAESNLSKRQKLEKEIADIRRVGLTAKKTEAEIEVQIAAARKKAADPPKVNADDNSAKSLADTMQRQIEANNELTVTGQKATASETLAIKVRQALGDKTNTMTAATRALLQVMLPMLAVSDKSATAAQAEAKAKEALTRQNAILEQQSQNRRDSNDVVLQSTGRGQEAIEQLQRRIAINRDYETELRRLGDKSVSDDKGTWEKLADNAKTQRDQMLREEAEFQRQRSILMADPVRGAKAAWEDYLSSSRDVAGQSQALLTGAFQNAEDGLVKFVKTGKLSFKELTNSIITDLARIEAKKVITGIVRSLFGTPKANAMGGIYQSPGLSAYSGQVVSQPTMFAFAKGAGLMGEAGPEAIMPLKRTQGGQLGVVASGGAGAGDVIVNVHGAPSTPTVNTRRHADGRRELDLFFRAVDERVADNIGRGGAIATAIRSRFNTEPRV